jgi:hypothetical protein
MRQVVVRSLGLQSGVLAEHSEKHLSLVEGVVVVEVIGDESSQQRTKHVMQVVGRQG